MKKKSLLFLILLSISGLSACRKSEITTDDIIDQLESAEYPIGTIVTYTEESDPNELLGRPNQYIAKVNFSDLRLEQQDEDEPIGGSIEIFENEEDCQDRAAYLKEISQESSFTEYNVLFDNILLRLNEEFTSGEAEAYVTAVQNIIDGKDVEECIINPEDTSSILVYFTDGLSDDEISQIGDKLNDISGVMDAEYTSADTAWEEYAKVYLGEENMELAEGFLEDNPLASSARYTVTAMNGNADKVASDIEEIDGVDKIEISQNESDEPLIN